MSGPSFLLTGAVIGFSVAAPVGPIGILCIQRSLSTGRASGIVSGLGAASADAFYGSLAAFGLTAVSVLLVSEKYWIQLLGGLFLLYLGIRTGFLSRAEQQMPAAEGGGWFRDYSSTMVLTLTNPLTILFFTAVFAGLGVAGTGGDLLSAGALVLGVFAGSALWWVILASAVDALRGRFNPARLRWLNRFSGGLILVFGLVALAAALESLL
jgi:threonine/homoserine/homoserine lactone efflux protein